MAKVAFIGLGSMGRPMAANLIARGFRVRGYDVSAKALTDLVTMGGEAAASAAEACSDADFVVLMVVDGEQAEAVLFAQGALEASPQSAVICLMATCSPQTVEAIAARVMATGRRFVDAPVSGGTAGAEAAGLTVMAAATTEVFESARPVFEALGSRIFRVGDLPGQGSVMKTINQLLCGVHIAAAAEAFSLAEKVGIDGLVALEILSGTAASSWMLRDRGPRMVGADPRVSSAVDIFVKDLGIVLDAGRQTKTALPLAALSHQLFLAASGRGKGHMDDSQVIESYRSLNAS
jgi:putative dehydrogenase